MRTFSPRLVVVRRALAWRVPVLAVVGSGSLVQALSTSAAAAKAPTMARGCDAGGMRWMDM